MHKNKKLLPGLFIFFIFICSCDNKLSFEEKELSTLKYSADKIERKFKWSNEIDGQILTDKIPDFSGLAKSAAKNVSSINVIAPEYKKDPVFPEVFSFSNLDLSNYTKNTLAFVKNFASDFINNKSLETYFSDGKLYELKIFKYNLEKINEGQKTAFADYLLGSPFANENIFECPVRFFYKDTYIEGQYGSKSLDLLLYLKIEDNVCKISQITFMEKEKVSEDNTDSENENDSM